MPRAHRALALLLAALFVGGSASARPPATPSPVTTGPCPFPAPAEVRCGVLTLPADERAPDGATIQLPFAIIPSRSRSPSPDPVLFPTSGGPGGSALVGLQQWLSSPLRDARDLILFEPRGARFARPALTCPEASVAFFESFGQVLPRAEEDARVTVAARGCAERLEQAGVNLVAYTSSRSAADIEALRVALGSPPWNLYGVSYGSRLVLETMRRYPAGVRSAILDSTYPPSVPAYETRAANAQRALETLVAGCAADTPCHTAYPLLGEQFAAVVARLNASPAQLTVTRPDTGAPFTMALTGEDVATGIFRALSNPQLIRLLPFVIDQLDRGNVAVLEPLAQDGLGGILTDSNARGLYYAVQCQEELPFNDPAAITADRTAHPAFGALPSQADLAVCAQWPGQAVAGSFRQPVTSPIPALVLAGAYDPVTPPEWGRLAAETLPQSFFFTFPGLGHATMGNSRCARQIAVAFLNEPNRRPDASCIAAMPGPAFVTTAWLAPTPVLYRVASRPGAYLPQLALVLFGALLAGWMLISSLLRRSWHARGKRVSRLNTPPGQVALLAAWPLLALAVIGAGVLTADPLTAGFGVQRWVAWLLVPMLAGSGSAFLLAIRRAMKIRRAGGARQIGSALLLVAFANAAPLVGLGWLLAR